ncbi:MAG: M23 family metallopeptidase [Spirochaetota bacterium]
MHKFIKKNKAKCLISASVLIVLFIIIAFSFYNGAEVDPDIRNHFSSENEFINYLNDCVEFPSLKFKFVEVKKGDNYWKIARDCNSNIDSLISVNIFWKDLLARVGDVVAVPDQRGVLEFITDYRQIEDLALEYEVGVDDIQVQKTPLFYSFYYRLISDRKPVAVFIKDAKPCSSNMTSALAAKFELREMFRSPLGGRLSSFYGNRKHPVYNTRRFHNGLDIAAKHGTLVGAARAGRVTATGWNGGYGKAVIVEHDKGYKTLYGHLSQINVRTGQNVSAGTIIGRVGSTGLSTGPHLHFTLWHNGKLINPMDVLW